MTWLILAVILLTIYGSANSQTLCNRKGDKNAFQVSDVDLLCDLSSDQNRGTKPKLIEQLLSGLDIQRIGTDSNSWVLRFRDRFGKARSLVISNLGKSRKLFTYPRKMLGNYEEVIGDSQWNAPAVRDSIGKLLQTSKKVDFDVRPPATAISFADIWRSIWRPSSKSSLISDMKKNADYMTSNKRKVDDNRDLFAKSIALLETPEKIYDKQYLEIMSKINRMSNAIKKAEQLIETKSALKPVFTDNSFQKLNISRTDEPVVKTTYKSVKPEKVDKFQQKFNKKLLKMSKNSHKYPEKYLLDLMGSKKSDKPIAGHRSESSQPLRRVPLSLDLGISGNPSKIYSPHQLIVPKIPPPTPVISATQVLSLPIDFAQTILPEPTSDMDTFTYRDALIAEESQALSQLLSNDNDFAFYTQINSNN